jgi:hypothetical protein
MDVAIIVLIALAIVGPIMIFATRYVVRVRARDMTRLWFITFFSYAIYYWLASSYGYIDDPNQYSVFVALVWPIAAILAFWTVEKVTTKGSAIFFLKWMVYFLLAALFAFVLDAAAAVLKWYSYNPARLDVTAFVNPLSGTAMPALMPLLMGILMMGVFFLVFNVHKWLRARRIDETSATLLLAALSVLMGGVLWVATDLALGFIRYML